tara:strand:- start:23955 stop:25004 length:1050 start_codon:yes stop_codon:yes gene_type:complete
MSLIDKLSKAVKNSPATLMSESPLFNEKDSIPTNIPIINVAFSGRLDGGLVPGLTILAGESKCFKTLLGLYCMKAYFEKYPDAIALVYDSEFGITPDYLTSIGIDTARVIHIPLEHIEQLKFDIVKRLEEIKRGDKVFLMVDSLGNLASKKEVEDASEGKSVGDMSRAKAIRSLLRMITPHLTIKDIPCIIVNHIYQTMEMYSKAVVGGGTAVTYASNQIFIITKAQEVVEVEKKKNLIGWNFTINIEKSRFVKERSRLPFTVTFENGIKQWSGLFDIAIKGNFLASPNVGWYSYVDEDGVIDSKKFRLKDTESMEFWQPFLDNERFKQYVKDRYSVSGNKLFQEDEVE